MGNGIGELRAYLSANNDIINPSIVLGDLLGYFGVFRDDFRSSKVPDLVRALQANGTVHPHVVMVVGLDSRNGPVNKQYFVATETRVGNIVFGEEGRPCVNPERVFVQTPVYDSSEDRPIGWIDNLGARKIQSGYLQASDGTRFNITRIFF